MAVALPVGSERTSVTSRTARQFARVLAISGAAVALGCLIYLTETYAIRPVRRCVESPVEVMMRTLGLAHFIVGWLFLLTSPGIRSLASCGRLGGLALLGAGLCILFALGGGMQNPFLLILFYGYFLGHEIRDETAIYQAYDLGPERRTACRSFLAALSRASAVLLTALLAGAFLLQDGPIAQLQRYDPRGVTLAATGVASLVLLGMALLVHALRKGRRVHGDVRSLVRAHSPLFAVYAGLLAILLTGSLFGSVGFHLIILVHVSAWMAFVSWQLGRSASSAGKGLWAWLRTTPSGFVTLHLVIAAVVFVLMVLRVYAWERDGLLCDLVSRGSFPYWSLMHISLALWRSR